MATPEFISNLRTHIGHEMLWLSGVKVVVFQGDQVLLVRRADNGLWTLPAGIIDPGEEPSHTAQREVLEETGVNCQVTDLIGVGVTAPTVYPNGDRAQYLDVVFKARHLSGQATINDDENLEVGYFDLQDRPQLPPLHERALSWALNPRPGGYFA
ncbi:NUDIX hydrolase [Arthrobacter sp. NIO-1057]|uniref:NUDIX hydrolase n=1 Tax=Arthrobacter sp. NIO-1057 TaxID=993071 RepID=UPI00071D8EAD|nr:NUDIX domain-containing protein [Arthrobacter sp. NIO-1057]KSU66617.1 DNA mismatch repair protein MutT [Arthrobacter sp. NIO-1057]SCC19273.1 ADP-ribose pyrophosphatase YjhB, NUDIX family [Arthrobacter sp. NIO-1057]